MQLKKLFVMTLILTIQSAFVHAKQDQSGSNLQPLSFADDQTIIDLSKVIWQPLNVEGLPAGAKIAVLRGQLDSGNSESVLKLPPGYYMPMHSHTSDELYVWIAGEFTFISHNKTEVKFDGPAYIRLPGNALPDGLKCGLKQSCILYIRLSRPFDIKYFPNSYQPR